MSEKIKRFVLGDIHGRHEALREVLKKSKFDKENDFLILLGDLVDGGYNTDKVLEEILTIKNVVFIVGNHDCLDDDTEALTKRGWKKYTELNTDDLVYSFDYENDKGVWSSINKIIIKPYSGNLISVVGNRLDMLMTPTHRVLCQRRVGTSFKDFEYIFANDLRTRIRIPTSAVQEHNTVEVDEDLIKIAAWILTDGSISKPIKDNHRKHINIYQSKKDMTKQIEELLKRLDLKFSKYTRERKVSPIKGVEVKNCLPQHHFSISVESSERILKFVPEKDVIPEWIYNLSKTQFNIFLNTFIDGDGTAYKHRKNVWIIYGTKNILEQLQVACIINGYTASLIKDIRNDWRLNVCTSRNFQFDVYKAKNEKHYDGLVWCLNVPLSNFMVRRNGKHNFTGNSWFMNYTFKGKTPLEWINQGGANTLNSYGGTVVPGKRMYEEPVLIDVNGVKIPKAHIEFFAKGLYYFEYDGMLFVHGGFDPTKPIAEQDQHSLMWDRELITFAGNKTIPHYSKVFIGHTTTQHIEREWVNYKCRKCKHEWDKPLKNFKDMRGDVVCPECKSNDVFQSLGCVSPIKIGNLFALDTGAGWSGKLTIMNIDDEKFWQSELQEPAITQNKN